MDTDALPQHSPRFFEDPPCTMSGMTGMRLTSALTLRTVAMVAAVLVATALGGWRAASIAEASPDPSTLVVNGVSYTVTHSEQVKGLSDADLGGASHGIGNLVSAEKALVVVTLVVSAGDSPTSYDASVLRAFATGSTAGLSPAGGTLGPGRLGAHARIDGSLSFVVPRNGAQLVLRAPGDSREVPLLQVDNAPDGAKDHEVPAGPDEHPEPATTPVTPQPHSP